MDVKKYIESGILELYVMDALSPAESKEVAALADRFEEIRQEILSIQETLNAYTVSQSISPGAGMKEKILQKINESTQPAKSKPESPQVPFNYTWLYLLLFLLAGLLIWKWLESAGKNSRNKQVIAELKYQLDSTHENCKIISDQLNRLKDPFTNVIALNETAPAWKGFSARVFWNKNENFTYLSVVNLPALDSGKQYELWSLKGGVAKSAGVFNFPEVHLQDMKVVDDAEMFAVSIEETGGSKTGSPSKDVILIGPVGP